MLLLNAVSSPENEGADLYLFAEMPLVFLGAP
jgi:hypothetical protein